MKKCPAAPSTKGVGWCSTQWVRVKRLSEVRSDRQIVLVGGQIQRLLLLKHAETRGA